MQLVEILLLLLAILFSYAVIVYLLYKKGILEKYDISFWGPALMWRTKRGRTFLQNIAKKKRFWKAFGSSAIVVCFIFMICMVLLLCWQTWSILETPEQVESLPGIEVAFIIPGINPILPFEYFWYIIIAFVIAIIVHEFSHGILSYASGLKVKSLGILYLIIPLGAFCEPDEEELKTTETKKRMRIFAAGPTSNFIVVLITLLLFSFVFMGAVQPAHEGAIVFSVVDDSPADTLGLQQGAIITLFNNTQITNQTTFIDELDKTKPNQTVELSYYYKQDLITSSIQLTNRYDELTRRGYQVNHSEKNNSFFGAVYLNTDAYNLFLSSLQNPFESFPMNFALIYILPLYGYLQGFNPIAAPC